ncbi:MAG: hypothetical protein ACK40O_06575 [Allosphingosinicella sp.]
MASRASRTLYAKGWAYLLATASIFIAILAAAPDRAEGPLMITWVAVAGLGSLAFRCPRCGKNLFMKGIMSVPWPAARCRRCGTDLTALPPAG